MTWLDRAMPDFVGIGAQRAGTTWVWAHLRRHPQIWTPRRKELHFFDRRLRRAGPFDRLRYAAWFIPGRLRRKVVGEVTPAYATLADDRVALIASWMPRVRIIYVMRDPVDRAWSQAAKGFQQWAGRPLDHANEEELLAFFELPAVVARGDYLSTLKTWRRHFAAEQILTCVSEQLFADPDASLRRMFAFLRVDTNVELDQTGLRGRLHAGNPPPIPPRVRARLQTMLYAQRDELEAMLDTRLPWGR